MIGVTTGAIGAMIGVTTGATGATIGVTTDATGATTGLITDPTTAPQRQHGIHHRADGRSEYGRDRRENGFNDRAAVDRA